MDNINDKYNFSSREQLAGGLWVYRDVFKKEFDFCGRLEQEIEKSNGKYNWEDATVGHNKTIKSYRDCVDFKVRKIDTPNKDEHELVFDEIWQECYDAQIKAVEDYCTMYSIRMRYWEAMNFIRYGAGQHFQEHSDDGFSYSATVSLVGYPNDDYEGGELYFNKFDYTVKPKAGDLYIFPSTYLFSHTAMPVTSGIKYSVVTMLDYNDHTHNPEYAELVKKRLENDKNS
jgi:hypothetical protein